MVCPFGTNTYPMHRGSSSSESRTSWSNTASEKTASTRPQELMKLQIYPFSRTFPLPFITVTTTRCLLTTTGRCDDSPKDSLSMTGDFFKAKPPPPPPWIYLTKASPVRYRSRFPLDSLHATRSIPYEVTGYVLCSYVLNFIGRYIA